MLEPDLSPDLERVVRRIDPAGELLRAWKMQGGISASMTALEIQHGDGTTEKVIVRQPGQGTLAINPNAARDEHKLLQLTRSFGIPTPASLYLDESGEILSKSYLVVEYMDGETVFAPRDLEGFVRQFATHLAKIHRVRDSDADLSFLPRQANGFPELPRVIAPNAALSFEYPRIRTILETAQTAYPKNPFCLVHGDYWQGNLLWREETLIAVVDWEDTRLGEPLYDVAISRLDLLTILGPAAMESFTKTYQALAPLDYSSLPYWDLNAAIRLARLAGSDLDEWAAFFVPFGRPDITARTLREEYQFFVTQALDQQSP